MRAIFAVLVLVWAGGISTAEAAGRRPSSLAGTVIPQYGNNWYTEPQAINNRGEIAGFAVHFDEQDEDGNEQEKWVVFIRSAAGRYQPIAERGFVSDMNDKSEVVGVIVPADEFGWPEGFVWSRRRGLQKLGSFIPFAINARSDMAGVCEPPGGLRQACLMRDGVLSVIPDAAEARGINRAGTVVGTYGESRGFRLSRHWRFTDLGRALAEDINDRGVIAGHRWMEIPGRGERAVVSAWTSRGVRSPGDVGLGLGINNRGWIISLAFRLGDDGGEESYCFAWNATTDARVMLTGGTDSFVIPAAINDHGLIVGSAGGRPILWRLPANSGSRGGR
jgi:hypothetical protein